MKPVIKISSLIFFLSTLFAENIKTVTIRSYTISKNFGTETYPSKDQNGIVGYGLGKAKEVTLAITKATDNAKKQLIRIPLLNGTIPHEQYGKYGGATVFIRPASSGTGVIAGGAMRSVIESVGVKDILAKSKGSTNPHNLVKATVQALMSLRDVNEIASARGISVSKVFNG